LSEQLGAWQTDPEQTLLEQSLLAEHPKPVPQVFPGAQAPPQSLSVSDPFFAPSLQLGA
jgi:hypothetical protein